ncbi:MAG TPA: phosphohistidine phosphatase, partial [Microbacterium sp.]|nr:phosphohistidine phosphatase [Microbacterium sp.]
ATIAAVIAERGADSVLVVAHDPGMSAMAGRLAPDIVHMPTCAVATFTWADGVDSWEAAFAVAPSNWRFDAPRLV